jgi:two-component system sensor histidine kinase QseC
LDAAPASVRELCALRAIAAEALVEVAPLSESKGVQLELSEGAELSVPGYPGLLRVLLRNLIDNAVRYSLPGTVVQVSVLQERGQTCIRVSDNGSGIPEAERDKVLERFYRPLGTGERGSGLGLSIVKRIAEIHGASLQLAPPQAGRGLSVTLHFPQP